MANERNIDYGIYQPGDAEAMARLLGSTFSRHDPPAVAMGLTADEFEAFVRLFCPNAAREGLTVVARRRDSTELVGAMLSEDCASPPPDGLEQLSPKLDPIFELLGQLDTEYWGGRETAPGEALHLFLLGVSERVAGRGVAQQLVRRCLEHGSKRGFRLAVTEATNRTSQHIFRKLGFAERVRGSYDTEAFRSIAEHGGPILMDRSPLI